MEQRQELVRLTSESEANVSELCRRFGVSRKTLYKWRRRWASQGESGLADLSRRPRRSPVQTSLEVEEQLVALRVAHPAWGGRKLRACLMRQGDGPVPAASTVTEILRRRGLLDPVQADKHRAFQQFEHEAPNDLWQMDFKGHFAMTDGRRCHPLTVLDDHSRFALGLEACPDERGETVQNRLIVLFRRYGLPRRMLMDNGSPWGDSPDQPHTWLTVWLLRLGVRISHGRPYHPQTQGKDERFHRTLNVELLRGREFTNVDHCQFHFDRWREVYNLERPHQALDYKPPVSRYHVSPRPYPERLPPVEYGPDDTVRKVQDGGHLSFQGHAIRVPRAFYRQPVALRPTASDGVFDIYFCHHQIAQCDLRNLPKTAR